MDTVTATPTDTPTPASKKDDNPALLTDNDTGSSDNKLEMDVKPAVTAMDDHDLSPPYLQMDGECEEFQAGEQDHDMNQQGHEGMELNNQMPLQMVTGQFCTQLSHPIQPGGIIFPTIEKLVEFRYDLVSMTQFQENRMHELAPYTAFNLGPNNPQVFVVVECCSHFFAQPACMYIAGEWVSTSILVPVAQHICVSMDDGIKRYEEIIKVDLLKSAHPSEAHVGFMTSIEHRVVRGNPSHRPRFTDILKRSLTESMRNMSDMQYEFMVSRPTGRNVSMDYRLASFFNDSRPGANYELHVNPLMQHIPQNLDLPLAGVRFKLAGFFYRPFVGYASLLLTRTDIQIFETLSLNFYANDRKVVAVAFDSAMVKIVGNPDGSAAVSLVDAASYSEFGPICSGVSVICHNARVPPSYHPFCNLSQNVIFNRGLNPLHSYTFNPPVSIPGHPPLPFYPAPYGYPFGCHMLPGLVQPVVQTPVYLPMVVPTVVDTTYQPQSRDNGSQCGQSQSDHRSPLQSPREKKTSAKESTTKLNPNARDFYPQGYHALVATPFPIQNGPEEITLTDLQTESEDQVILSSSMGCGSMSISELEAFHIHANPAEKSESSEISMLVNRTSGGFLNQSDSHCSLFDPETTLEILSTSTQNTYSWSEQVENEEKVDGQNGRLDGRNAGNRGYRGGGGGGGGGYRGGYRAGHEEQWSSRGHRYSNYRWNSSRQHSRQDSGEPVDPNTQDLRVGHGFNNRGNFNQTRPNRPYGETWGYRGRGGRGRGSYGYPRNPDYEQDRRYNGNPSQSRDRRSEDRKPPQQEDTNHSDQKSQSGEPQPIDSEPESCPVAHSDSDEVVDQNRRVQTPVSYAAAARTNVPEDQLQVPAKAQIFTPTAKAESVKSQGDEEEFGQNNNYRGQGRGHYNNNYRGNNRSDYRPASVDNNPNDYGSYRQSSQDYYHNGGSEYNDQRPSYRGKSFYNKYPPRENWNSCSGEAAAAESLPDNSGGPGPSNYAPRGGRYQTNQTNRYQNQQRNNFPAGKYSNPNPKRGGGSGRGPQDVPTPNDFPPLSSVPPPKVVIPPKEPKELPAKTTAAKATAAPKAQTRNKKFKKFDAKEKDKESTGSSDDYGSLESYLSDVIPNEDRAKGSKARKDRERKVEEEPVESGSDHEQPNDDDREDEEEVPREMESDEEDDVKVEVEMRQEDLRDEKILITVVGENEDPKDPQGDGDFQPEILNDEQSMEKTPGSNDSKENGMEDGEGTSECPTDVEAGGEPCE